MEATSTQVPALQYAPQSALVLQPTQCPAPSHKLPPLSEQAMPFTAGAVPQHPPWQVLTRHTVAGGEQSEGVAHVAVPEHAPPVPPVPVDELDIAAPPAPPAAPVPVGEPPAALRPPA